MKLLINDQPCPEVMPRPFPIFGLSHCYFPALSVFYFFVTKFLFRFVWFLGCKLLEKQLETKRKKHYGDHTHVVGHSAVSIKVTVDVTNFSFKATLIASMYYLGVDTVDLLGDLSSH